MDDADVFAVEAADVALQVIKEGHARISLTWDEGFNRVKSDISAVRQLTQHLMNFL